MPNDFIKHAFVSPKGDGPDPTLVRPSNWNDGLTYAGGINGQILVYDNTQDNNMRWVDGRTNSINSASIVSSTTTPINSLTSFSGSYNSSNAFFAVIEVLALTTVGAALATLELQIDSVTYRSFNFASGAGPANFISPGTVASGNHTFSIRLTTAGNVNVLTASVSLILDTSGR